MGEDGAVDAHETLAVALVVGADESMSRSFDDGGDFADRRAVAGSLADNTNRDCIAGRGIWAPRSEMAISGPPSVGRTNPRPEPVLRNVPASVPCLGRRRADSVIPAEGHFAFFGKILKHAAEFAVVGRRHPRLPGERPGL